MSQSKNGSGIGKVLRKIIHAEQSALFIALVVVFAAFSICSDSFLTGTNIWNVLRQFSLIGIAGVGMVLIILVGEIDLSVGSTQAAVGITSVTVLNATGSIFLAAIVAIATGVIIGLMNGLLVTRAGLNSLIATLGTMAIIRSVGMIATQAVSIPVRIKGFSEIGTGYLGPIPIPVIICAIVIALFFYILNSTVFGRYIYAVGGNQESAKLAGLPIKSIKLLAYVIGNVLFAISAFILASRMNTGQAIAGTGFEMQVIAAVILGGISLDGGKGTLLGAIIGMLILSILQNGLVLMNVSSFYHDLVRGLVIILAVYLDVRREKNRTNRLLSTKES